MDNSVIDQVRNANDIVDVVMSYMPLKKAGSNYRGLCPFHNDSNPSMHVSQSKQIFKCFVCGKAGNVFTFVQEYEKLSFMEAVKKLAAKAGISLPQYERTKVVSTKRELLLHAYKSAGNYFKDSLFNHGNHVLAYLSERKFSPETAKELELGYALNSEKGLLNYLLKEGVNVALLKESGLFGLYSGNLVDLFRDRLMFPIHNHVGEVVAFGGRILQSKTEAGKYINSPGTELYTKGKELYGLFKTKYEIAKAGSGIVCEGYFDFLRLYESGFKNSVASLGTALTEDQVYLLARYCSKVYMLYDGDAAGIKAAVRAAMLCMGKGIDAYIVQLPDKHDPDTYILEKGKAALTELMENAPRLIPFFAAMPDKDLPAAERINRLLDVLRPVQDAIKRELLIKEVSEVFQISTAALNSKIRNSSSKPPENEPQRPVEQELHAGIEERHALILALKEPICLKALASELDDTYFYNKTYKDIYHLLMKKLREDVPMEPASLLDSVGDTALCGVLADLIFEDLPDLRFEETLKQVKIRKLQRDMEALDRMINKEPQNLELFKQKTRLAHNYRLLTKKVVHKLVH